MDGEWKQNNIEMWDLHKYRSSLKDDNHFGWKLLHSLHQIARLSGEWKWKEMIDGVRIIVLRALERVKH